MSEVSPRPEINTLYKEAKPQLLSSLTILEKSVNDILKGKVKDFYITSRIKSLRSILKNVRKYESKYNWDHIRDLIGIRIICSTQADCELVVSLINDSNLNITRTIIKGGPVDGLFYAGTHLLVKVEYEENDQLRSIKGEIQIRTRAQDAWSVVEHKLVYKSDEVPLPETLRRKINRLSALVEMFDDDVQEVFSARRDLDMYKPALAFEYLESKYEILTGESLETVPDLSLIKTVLRSYPSIDLGEFEILVANFCQENSNWLPEIIANHSPEADTYVDSKDWLFSQPEILSILERAQNKPFLLVSAIKDSDLEDVVRNCCISANRTLPN